MIPFKPVHSRDPEELQRVVEERARRAGVRCAPLVSGDVNRYISTQARRMGRSLGKRVGQVPPSGSLEPSELNIALKTLARRIS